MPTYHHVSIWLLKDMATGKVLRIPADRAKHLSVPYYESLTVEKMLAWAAKCQDGVALKYLPENKLDLRSLPRQYICNVLYTILEDDFLKWRDA